MMEQVAWNKLDLLRKIIVQNTQILQLFAKIIKTEIFYKSYLNAKLEALGSETNGLTKKRRHKCLKWREEELLWLK